MNLRDRGDASHGIGKSSLDAFLRRRIGLQVQQRGDDLQRVADAVVDLAQQHFALGCERRIAIARGMDFGFGFVAGLLKFRLAQRAVDGNLEQRDEIAPDILDQIVGGTRLQRGDGDRGILRGRDEHHRRGIRDLQDLLERLQAIEAGHVLIERDDVDAALGEALQALLPAGGMDDLEAVPRQAAVDQAGQRRVVVNVQQCRRGVVHAAAGGTWMTEKNRPSWRMALAKLS